MFLTSPLLAYFSRFFSFCLKEKNYHNAMVQTIIGIFDNRVDADATVDELKNQGYNPKDISIIMQDNTQDPKEDSVAKGATSGIVTGGVIGGIAGLLIGIGAIVIPGIGALLIGGPLAAAFGITGAAATTVSGAATGAVAGGIIGALTGIGVPEEEARAYEEHVRQGGIVVAVNTNENEADKAKALFERNNAQRLRILTA